MDWKAENPSEISPKRDHDRANVRNFWWPLLAEAVSKLDNSLTPEVAFKHNVRRY